MSVVGKVHAYMGGKQLLGDAVPKSEFAAHIQRGDTYKTGVNTYLVLEKLWHLLPSSSDAEITLTVVKVEGLHH